MKPTLIFIPGFFISAAFLAGCSTPCSCLLPKSAAVNATTASPSPSPTPLGLEVQKVKNQIDFIDAKIGNDESEIESIGAVDEPPYDSRVTSLNQDIKRLQRQKSELVDQMRRLQSGN